MAQLQRSIDSVRLPRAFQDAIKIARHIGIDYLWIDSLCIQQDEDDLSDWLVESKKMGQIYESACLNISATWAVHGFERLLGQSNWTSKFPSQTELQVDEGPPRKYHVVDGTLWDDEVERGPLNDRGWVFQERILARRVVHFGQTQLGWECKSSQALGMFPDGLPVYLGGPEEKPCTEIISSPKIGVTQGPDKDFAKTWQRLMGQFTGCQLSFRKDKLIALEGIATSLERTRPYDTYAAGMWRSTALFDLPWWRFEEDREEFPIAETHLRAPSWSWASVDGEIGFPLAHNVFPNVREQYAIVKGLTGHKMDPNGDIINPGTMQVEGICLPMSIQWLENDSLTGFSVPGFRFSTKRRTLESSLHLESSLGTVKQLSHSGKLLLMPLFVTTNALFCILLEKIRGPRTHRRIGSAEIAVMVLVLSGMEGREGRDVLRQPCQFPSGGLAAEISDEASIFWNKPAVKFIDYLREQSPSARLITIL